MWTWNRAQQSKVCGVEIKYLRGACGVTRWEGESNESMYKSCGMGPCAKRVKCVVKWVKKNSLRCFGHIKRKNSEEFVKKVPYFMAYKMLHLGKKFLRREKKKKNRSAKQLPYIQ